MSNIMNLLVNPFTHAQMMELLSQPLRLEKNENVLSNTTAGEELKCCDEKGV